MTDESDDLGPEADRPDDGHDDIPLNIAGHEAEKARREGSEGPSENGGTPDSEGADAVDDSGAADAAGVSDAADAAGESEGAAATDDSDTPDAGAEPDADTDGDGDGAVLSEFDVDGSAADDDEVEPVELLVQLAEDGEIDPWDIDVVRVTDKFLDRLDGADLRTGGRALFYASVLLRMKSDVMWAEEPDDPEPDPEPWEAAPADGELDPAVDPFAELEREMDRRIERKTARGTPETLDELVRDLRERERETWWKESRTYDTSESPSGYSRGTQTLDYHSGDDFRMDDEPTADDVTGTAHDEHMEDIINDVYVALQAHYDAGREEVLFAEVREAGGSVVDTFLGLLFLAHRGRVHLEQDECFGDLWIQDPAAVEVGETAAPADD